MILTLTEFGNPILRAKAKQLPLDMIGTPAFKQLIENMFKTMRATNGVGIAAPQIGISLQLAVIELEKDSVKSEKIVLINPRVLSNSKTVREDWEGCLSFGGKRCARGKVPRASSVVVRYTDENKKTITRKASGFLARVFQHEIDHLNGSLFVDRMKDMKTLMTYEEFLRRMVKGSGPG